MTTPPTLEERVRKLEAFRYTMLGQYNAMRTVIFSAWNAILSGHGHLYAENPLKIVQEMRAAWREPEVRKFSGMDPAQLDAIWQEYEKAIDQLSAELLKIAQGLEKMRKD